MTTNKVGQSTNESMAQILIDDTDTGGGTAVINVYSGTEPATPQTALSGNTLLLQYSLQNPSMTRSGNVDTIAGLPLTDDGLAADEATFARVIARDGTTVTDQFDVGVSGATGIISPSATVAIGQTFELTVGSFTLPPNSP